MTARLVKTTIVLLVTAAVLNWLRSDRFEFDVRSIIPFGRGEITIFDWAGLAILLLGLWGYGRLCRDPDDSWPGPEASEAAEYEEDGFPPKGDQRTD